MAKAKISDGAASGVAELWRLFSDGHARTRSEIGSKTGWARSTIDVRLEMLRAAGLIDALSAQSTGGRPSTRFQLAPESLLIVAIELGQARRRVALTDLLGRVLIQRQLDADIEDGPEQVLGWSIETALALAHQLGRSSNDLAAVGVSLPSPVERETGRPFNPVSMTGWTNFDVSGFVSARLSVPTRVDNDANLLALGELAQAFPDETDMLFIKVAENGLGAGVIAGGEIQRGGWGVAGDIGHVPVPRGAGIPCACGNTGCIARLVSVSAIAEAIRGGGVTVGDGRDIVRLVDSGTIEAIHAVRQAGRDLGEFLVACITLMNPSLIVIGGDPGHSPEHLIAGVREVVYARTLPLVTEHLNIVASQTGDEAALVGASALASESIFTTDGTRRALRSRSSNECPSLAVSTSL